MRPLTSAFITGVVSGLRSMTGLATTIWGVGSGRFAVPGRTGNVLASPWSRWAASALAAGELAADKLPMAPARTEPGPFGARVVIGAAGGAVVGGRGGRWAGAAAGLVGAVAGTLGGYRGRAALAEAFGSDWPAAAIEDAVTIGLAALVLRTSRAASAETAVVRRPMAAVS